MGVCILVFQSIEMMSFSGFSLRSSIVGRMAAAVRIMIDAVRLMSVSSVACICSRTSARYSWSLSSGNPRSFKNTCTGSGSQMTGLAARITVNPALLTNPSNLSVFTTSPATAPGDTTRSNFIFSQLTSATFTYSPQTGLGSAGAPFKGTIAGYMQQFLSLQGNAAASATQLQQGQDVVVSTLQQKFNSTSGVSIDTEMSNLIALQNSYAANAHVMSVVQSMMNTLLQAQI